MTATERITAVAGERTAVRERSRRLATGLMALALAASPAYVERPHLGPLPTTLLEIPLVIAIAVGLYAYRDELPWRSPYLWPVALLLVAATIDTVVAPDRRAAAGLWKAYFAEPALAGLVIAAIARSRVRARFILAGLAIAGSYAAVLNGATVLWAIGHNTFNVVTPPVAIYNSANAVPLYLEPLAAFALAIAFFSDDPRERIVAVVFSALAAVAIFLSYSRAGWATFAALVLFVALFGRRRWRVLAGMVAVGGLLFAASGSVRRRVLVEFDPYSTQNTIGLRLSLWRSSLNMLAHKPFFGGGLSGFKASILPYKDPAYHEDLIYPHNVLLNFWSETGLLGLAAFVWLMIQTVRTALRGLALGPWPRAMAIGLLGLAVAFGLHGLVDLPYFKNDQALAFWALVGVQLGSLRPHPR
jgi:O-antigen ligase